MRASRQAAGFSLRELALRVHVSASVLCEVENGKEATPDLVARVIKATHDYGLAAEACRRCPIPRITKGPRLSKERVDLHIMSIHSKVAEELQEAIESHHRLTPLLINKRRPEDFRPDEIRTVRDFIREALQVVVAIEHEALALAELTGTNPEELIGELHANLRQKGYVD